MIEQVLKDFTYKDNWNFKVTKENKLLVSASVPDSRTTAKQNIWISLSFPIKKDKMTKNEVLRFIRKSIMKIELHEMDEWIKHEGKLVFDPH